MEVTNTEINLVRGNVRGGFGQTKKLLDLPLSGALSITPPGCHVNN